MTGERDKFEKAGPGRRGHASGEVGRRKPKPLSAEDHALWDITARTTEPLRRVKSRVHRLHEDGEDGVLGKRPTLEPEQRRATGRTQHAATAAGSAKPHPIVHEPVRKPLAPPLAKFDRNTERGLRSGRVDIEARIDLHGMRQAEAHMALRNFLHSCHNRDLGAVLVITGKGAPSDRPDDDTPFWMGGEGERGVLRRNVPRWLAEPDLRAIVVSFTTAAVRHGGDGALYIHLRRRMRHGG